MPEPLPGLTQRIRERAYVLWQQDGCRSGQADRHWRGASSDEHAAAELLVDVEEEDSFPASDPPSRSVVTGLR